MKIKDNLFTQKLQLPPNYVTTKQVIDGILNVKFPMPKDYTRSINDPNIIILYYDEFNINDMIAILSTIEKYFDDLYIDDILYWYYFAKECNSLNETITTVQLKSVNYQCKLVKTGINCISYYDVELISGYWTNKILISCLDKHCNIKVTAPNADYEDYSNRFNTMDHIKYDDINASVYITTDRQQYNGYAVAVNDGRSFITLVTGCGGIHTCRYSPFIIPIKFDEFRQYSLLDNLNYPIGNYKFMNGCAFTDYMNHRDLFSRLKISDNELIRINIRSLVKRKNLF